MLQYLYFVLLISLHQYFAYHIAPRPTFSEVVESITRRKHLEHLTITHPLYDEIAGSILPIEIYKTLIQQDHLYIQTTPHVFRILAERENNLRRKNILLKFRSESLEYLQLYNAKFNFTPAVHMIPSTLEYAASQMIAAKYENIGVAMATGYSCYTIWEKMGIRFSKIVNFVKDPLHPYKEFIEANTPSEQSTQRFLKYTEFLNEYYDELENSTELQQQMVEAYLRSVELEFAFANGIYQQKPATVHGTAQFTDMVELVSPKLQNDVIYHDLYQELSDGVVPFGKFNIFLQQRDIYLRGFHKAFEYLTRKETDPSLKTELTKIQKSSHSQYRLFNVEPALFTEYYTNAYMEHVLSAALQEPVAVGLASLYPYYSLWNKIGNWLANSMHPSQSTYHPYKMFIEANDLRNNKQMEAMNELINGYYNGSANDIEIQYKMIQAVRKSINHELLMANGVYEFGRVKFGGQ